MRVTGMLAAALVAALGSRAAAQHDHHDVHKVVRAELGATLLSEGDELLRACSLAAQAGFRRGAWGTFGVLELNSWLAPRLDARTSDRLAVVNVGVGGDFLFAGGVARIALAAGPSWLVLDSTDDSFAGSIGLFIDLRPAGLRFTFEGARLGFDPLSLRVIAPALSSIPIVDVQFATSLYLELDP